MLPRVNRRRTAVSDGGGKEGQVSFVPGSQGVGALDAIRSPDGDRFARAPHLLKGDIIAASELCVPQFILYRVGHVSTGLLNCSTASEREEQRDGNCTRDKL